MAGRIQLKFGIGGALLKGVTAAKLVNFHSGTIELRMCEKCVSLVPAKYTLVCHASAVALAVLGCMTHYCVS